MREYVERAYGGGPQVAACYRLGFERERAARETMRLIDEQLAIGFVVCSQCGHEEPTKELDARLEIRDALAAAPRGEPAPAQESAGEPRAKGETP